MSFAPTRPKTRILDRVFAGTGGEKPPRETWKFAGFMVAILRQVRMPAQPMTVRTRSLRT